MDESRGAMPTSSSSSHTAGVQSGVDEEDDEEMLMQRALELSMVSSPQNDEATSGGTTTAAPVQSIDPDFLQSLLGSVDVDLNDPLIQAALAQLEGASGTATTKDDTNSKKRKSEGNDRGDNDS
jgi:hypothetical protein